MSPSHLDDNHKGQFVIGHDTPDLIALVLSGYRLDYYCSTDQISNRNYSLLNTISLGLVVHLGTLIFSPLRTLPPHSVKLIRSLTLTHRKKPYSSYNGLSEQCLKRIQSYLPSLWTSVQEPAGLFRFSTLVGYENVHWSFHTNITSSFYLCVNTQKTFEQIWAPFVTETVSTKMNWAD